MPRGLKCRECNNPTFHHSEELGFRKCTTCGCIGWSILDQVKNPGSGPGHRCPQCSKRTLHQMDLVGNGKTLYRCRICLYSLIGNI